MQKLIKNYIKYENCRYTSLSSLHKIIVSFAKFYVICKILFKFVYVNPNFKYLTYFMWEKENHTQKLLHIKIWKSFFFCCFRKKIMLYNGNCYKETWTRVSQSPSILILIWKKVSRFHLNFIKNFIWITSYTMAHF